MSFRRERIGVGILLGSFMVFFLWYASASQGVYQGGDTFQHYLIARYAWQHPHLFLDHWGKPVFTTIYALPATFGYGAAECMTVCIGIATAWITYLSAKKLELHYAWATIVIVLFTPIYFVHLNAVMTEILFAFWLIAGIYIVLRQRYLLAAVFLSFLPFVRTEGFILLPVIGIYFLAQQKWKAFFLLGTGFLFYSLLGSFFYYNDFWWVFNNNPYDLESPYGSGNFFHFITSNKVTWGIPVSIALVFAMLHAFRMVIRRDERVNNGIWCILIVLPFLVFLIFHSVAWATGSMASNGELRVITCTSPLVALAVVRLFSDVHVQLKTHWLTNGVVLIFVCFVIITPFQLNKIPAQMNISQNLVHDACTVVANHWPDRRIHFVDPQIPVELNRDPYDASQLVQWYADPIHPENQMRPGDLVIWEAHYTPHEGGVSYDRFNGNPNFNNIAEFKPEVPYLIFGREEYFVAIFEYIRKP